MLVLVEKNEALDLRRDFSWRVEICAWGYQWPEASAKDGESRVYRLCIAHSLKVILEVAVQVLGDLHVGEHALEFIGILETARLLQFADHTRLRIVGGRVAVYQATGEHA